MKKNSTPKPTRATGIPPSPGAEGRGEGGISSVSHSSRPSSFLQEPGCCFRRIHAARLPRRSADSFADRHPGPYYPLASNIPLDKDNDLVQLSDNTTIPAWPDQPAATVAIASLSLLSTATNTPRPPMAHLTTKLNKKPRRDSTTSPSASPEPTLELPNQNLPSEVDSFSCFSWDLLFL